jgi:hypothetical protein
MIFNTIERFWKNNGLKILLIFSITLILILWILNWGGHGTYDLHYYYDKNDKNDKKKVRFDESSEEKTEQKPPKESKLEIATKASLERLLKKPFHKERPDFLRNPVTKNFNLELDCFNPELKLGVEVNGIQHYKYVPYFHKNFDAFRNQQYRDELKRRMCKDEGVILIEVPYTVKIPDIDNFLINELRKNGFSLK